MNGKFQIIWYTREENPNLEPFYRLVVHHFATGSEEAARALTTLIQSNGDESGVLFTPIARLQVLKTTDQEIWSEPKPPQATKE